MKAVIVTGGNGFLGKHLITVLLDKGYYVYNIVRHQKNIWEDKPNYQELVCVSTDDLPGCCSKIKQPVQCIYHFAWSGVKNGEKRRDVDIQLQNIKLAIKIVDLAEKVKAERLIYAGTIMEYECLNNLTQDNGEYGSRNGLYASAKLSAHFMMSVYAKSKDIYFIPIIFANVYGTGRNASSFMNDLIRKMHSESSIDLTYGKQLQDYIYVSDAIEMTLYVTNYGQAFQQYYIGNREQYPLKEYIQRAASCVGYTGKLNFGAVPYHDLPLKFTELDTGIFYETFSYRPKVSFEEGIRKLYQEVMEETA